MPLLYRVSASDHIGPEGWDIQDTVQLASMLKARAKEERKRMVKGRTAGTSYRRLLRQF